MILKAFDLLTGDLFPNSFWKSYWEYLESYSEARRTLEELKASEDTLLHFLTLRQAAARHSPLSLLLLPVSYSFFFLRYNQRRILFNQPDYHRNFLIFNKSIRTLPWQLKYVEPLRWEEDISYD